MLACYVTWYWNAPGLDRHAGCPIGSMLAEAETTHLSHLSVVWDNVFTTPIFRHRVMSTSSEKIDFLSGWVQNALRIFVVENSDISPFYISLIGEETFLKLLSGTFVEAKRGKRYYKSPIIVTMKQIQYYNRRATRQYHKSSPTPAEGFMKTIHTIFGSFACQHIRRADRIGAPLFIQCNLNASRNQPPSFWIVKAGYSCPFSCYGLCNDRHPFGQARRNCTFFHLTKRVSPSFYRGY